MKKKILLLLALATSLAALSQINIPYQEIRYDAHYHFGFVNVVIGHAKITLSGQGENFYATFDGNTIPWEGRVYCVSDTLNARFSPGQPYSRETVTYVNGWYMKPRTSAYRGGRFNPSDAANYKNIKGQGDLDASPQTMEAIAITADMLGLFNYFREIDFDKMAPGERISLPIAVEGGEEQSVTITYNGRSTAEAGGVLYQTYSTVYEFTYHGAPSGYPVKTEVAVDSRLPVSMTANLAIGRVELFLI